MEHDTEIGSRPRHAEPSRRARFPSPIWLGIVVAVVIAVVGAGIAIGSDLAHRSSTPSTGAVTTEPTPAPAGPAPPVGVPSTATPAPNGPADLVAEFAELANTLHSAVGVVVSAAGDGQNLVTLGDWQTGPAWSTIKVPLAIAALREEDPPEVTDAMRAAITRSDNEAAESIWQGLGDPETAAHKVEAVLSETGDPTIVQSQRVRPEFTAFGQTVWSLTDQARFTSRAVCDARNEPIFALMGQIEADQSWGLGAIPGVRFKGGWGPSESGSYLVRQIGVLPASTGMVTVAIAAQPDSGSLTDGTQDLTEVANWLSAHIGMLPAGQCGQ
jgi:hypothetical protein